MSIIDKNGQPTPDQCEETFRRALRTGDAWGIVSALMVMSTQDPHRAESLMQVVQTGIDISKASRQIAAEAPSEPALGRPGRLVIVCGLPSSGKTTWTRRYVAASPFTRIRSNRDDRRDSQWGGWTGDARHEDAVTAAQHGEIRAWLRDGWEVVVDDTNLNPRTVQALTYIGWEVGVEVEIQDFTYVDVDTCIDRDAVRAARGERFVGADVIRDKHAGWLAQRIASTRAELAEALNTMHERLEWMREHSARRWAEDQTMLIRIGNSSQVLGDDQVRAMLEELTKFGRAARIVVELCDTIDGPGTAQLGGSLVLKDLLAAGVESLRYRRIEVDR